MGFLVTTVVVAVVCLAMVVIGLLFIALMIKERDWFVRVALVAIVLMFYPMMVITIKQAYIHL